LEIRFVTKNVVSIWLSFDERKLDRWVKQMIVIYGWKREENIAVGM